MHVRRGAPLIVAMLAALAMAACGNKAEQQGGGSSGASSGGAYPSKDLKIMAPADPGGGWDETARVMQQSIRDGGVTKKNVEVYNVPGAGGTIGLNRLVSKESGNAFNLMVMGLVMVGAIETNKSPTDLSKTTPIAALTAEPEAIVVAAKSKYKTLDDLLADFKANPAKVSWAGGSAGGTDQILVGLIAKQQGVDPKQVKYVAHSGGGEAKAAILSGGVSAGVSGVSEFSDQVEAGKMRALAVSTSSPVPVGGKSVKPLSAQGVDVEITNWRGLVAPPGIDDATRDKIVAMVDKLHGSQPWQAALKKYGWDDFYKTGDEFQTFLQSETERVKGVVRDLGLSS
jgi:putative tricarboxylic transport membrane protein